MSYDLSPHQHWHWYSRSYSEGLRLEYAAESMLASASASGRYPLRHCGLYAVLVSVLERGWYLKMMQHNRQLSGASLVSVAIAIENAVGELEERRRTDGMRRAHRTP